MHFPSFIGPTYSLRSPNADAERCINFYPEQMESPGAKSPLILVGTPGLVPYVHVDGQPGVFGSFAQAGRAFAVIGTQCHEVFYPARSTNRGTVRSDGNPAQIASNGTGGHQLLIVSGGFGYIYDLNANTLTKIADADFPAKATHCCFVDGYFIVLADGAFYLSALEDGTSWDALDINQRSDASDPWVSMILNHRELWLFGEATSDVYYDTGDLNTPFAPIPGGAVIEQGTIAPYSPCLLTDTILWLGGDKRGSGIVYAANGYTPKRISNHAVEGRLQPYRDLPATIGWTYQDSGHQFYSLYIPNADVQWTTDVAVSFMWHERALWDDRLMAFTPHLAQNHMFAFNRHLVGDRQSGTIYELSLDQLVDDVYLT